MLYTCYLKKNNNQKHYVLCNKLQKPPNPVIATAPWHMVTVRSTEARRQEDLLNGKTTEFSEKRALHGSYIIINGNFPTKYKAMQVTTCFRNTQPQA